MLLAELVFEEDTEVVGTERHFRLQGVLGNDALGFSSRIRLQDVSRNIGWSLPYFLSVCRGVHIRCYDVLVIMHVKGHVVPYPFFSYMLCFGRY